MNANQLSQLALVQTGPIRNRYTASFILRTTVLLVCLSGCSRRDDNAPEGDNVTKTNSVSNKKSVTQPTRRKTSDAQAGKKRFADLMEAMHRPIPERIRGIQDPIKRSQAEKRFAQDNVRQFSAEDLLAIGRELCKAPIVSDSLSDREDQFTRISARLDYVFLHYTDKTTGDKGAERLMTIIQDRRESPILREFLINKIEIYPSLPDNVQLSANPFTNALNRYATKNAQKAVKMLGTILNDQNDHPHVRAAAIHVRRNWLKTRMEWALQSDPNVVEYIKTHTKKIVGSSRVRKDSNDASPLPAPRRDIRPGKPLYPDDLVRNGTVKVAKHTANELNLTQQLIQAESEMLRGIFEGKGTPAVIKAAIVRAIFYLHNAVVDQRLRDDLSKIKEQLSQFPISNLSK